jgi:hypothetical protein
MNRRAFMALVSAIVAIPQTAAQRLLPRQKAHPKTTTFADVKPLETFFYDGQWHMKAKEPYKIDMPTFELANGTIVNLLPRERQQLWNVWTMANRRGDLFIWWEPRRLADSVEVVCAWPA